MKKIVELPLIEPLYSTYHHGCGSAVVKDNITIQNWYLNQVMILYCNRKFLKGFTSPEINVVDVNWRDNPYLEKVYCPLRFLGGYVNRVIQNMLDQGYYVCFSGVDDYYVEGKSWYKERHFYHDGCICGYNNEDRTYCIYAYDKNWIYQKFWTTQKSFNQGIKSMIKQRRFGFICAVKPKTDQIAFSSETALKKISEYMDSTFEKYPENGEGNVYGIIVHDYVAKYVGKLYDGSVPHERMDRRVFRMIWEHKKVMLERIQRIEKELSLDSSISKKYENIVAEAETMRMLYASYHMRQRNPLLPVIQKKLLSAKDSEAKLLMELLEKTKDIVRI